MSDLFRKILLHATHGIRRRLAQAADGGVDHDLVQVFQRLVVPLAGLHELRSLARAHTTRCALAAVLVFEEMHHVQRRVARLVGLRQHNDGRRSDEAAMRLQGVEVERDVGHTGRQDAAGCAARQVGIQLVTFLHAAAELIDQFTQRYAGGRELDARLLHAAAHAVGTQTLAAIAPEAAEPGRAAFDDVAHPVQGFKIVLERWTAEEADLRDIGWSHARFAALALDALDHRGLFAADVRAGAAAKFDEWQREGRIGPEPFQFAFQDGATAVIFITQVDVAGLRAHHLRGDEQTLEKAVRIAFEVGTVLERPGFALVDVHRHETRCRLLAHDAPLAPGRKSGAAQPAQAR